MAILVFVVVLGASLVTYAVTRPQPQRHVTETEGRLQLEIQLAIREARHHSLRAAIDPDERTRNQHHHKAMSLCWKIQDLQGELTLATQEGDRLHAQ